MAARTAGSADCANALRSKPTLRAKSGLSTNPARSRGVDRLFVAVQLRFRPGKPVPHLVAVEEAPPDDFSEIPVKYESVRAILFQNLI